MTILIIIVLLVALVAGWVMSTQRRLVVMDENINNAMSQIGVQLSSRFDALSALLDLAVCHAADGSRALNESVRSRRSAITSASSPADVVEQERVISSALERLQALADACPALREDGDYACRLNAADAYEKMVRTSCLIYNDAVTRLDRELHTAPTRFASDLLGFHPRETIELP